MFQKSLVVIPVAANPALVVAESTVKATSINVSALEATAWTRNTVTFENQAEVL